MLILQRRKLWCILFCLSQGWRNQNCANSILTPGNYIHKNWILKLKNNFEKLREFYKLQQTRLIQKLLVIIKTPEKISKLSWNYAVSKWQDVAKHFSIDLLCYDLGKWVFWRCPYFNNWNSPSTLLPSSNTPSKKF